MPLEASVLKNCVTQASSWSSISWHIEDVHERFSMCNTNPENDLKSIPHPGHVDGRMMLSSEFKGISLDSFSSFSFKLLLLEGESVATEQDPSKFDKEESAFLRPNMLDITKERRKIRGLSLSKTKQHTKRSGFTRLQTAQFRKPITQSGTSH